MSDVTNTEKPQLNCISKRIVHIDMLRIIAAFFVIFNHTGKSGFTMFLSYKSSSFAYWFYLFFSVLSKVSVPIFFMISGALLLNKEQEPYKKILFRELRIFAVLFVFSVLSYSQQIYIGAEKFSIKNFVKVFISSTWMSPYWYLYAYLGFLLTLPLLRRLANSMTKKDYIYLIFLVVVVTGIVPIFLYLMTDGKLKLNSNFSISWIASQVCFYPLIGFFLERMVDIKKVSYKLLAIIWFINLLSALLTCYTTYYNNKLTKSFPQTFLMSLTAINAICLYITLKKLFINVDQNNIFTRIIQLFGSCTFGIYLFHGLLLRAPDISLYLKFDSIFKSFPLIKITLRCIEIMIIAGAVTYVLKKIPIVKRLL